MSQFVMQHHFCVQNGVKRGDYRGHRAARVNVVATALPSPHEADSSAAVQRRAVTGLLGLGFLTACTRPAEAAYGDAARVFGAKPTNSSGFVPYQAKDFSILLPARWNPTLERDRQEVKLRYEDTYPANNIFVYAKKTSKNSVADFGGPDKFLQEITYLFGDNVWQGATRSEGGFKPGQVSNASILDYESVTGKDGKPHYNLHVLTRSADGNEGGKHHIISAAVSGGQLYVMKAQIGDKRWNKGGSRDSKMLQDSFKVV